MVDFLRDIRSKIVHAKLFSQRGMGYISIINSAMILFMLLSNLERYGIDIDIAKWFFPILIVGIFLLFSIGFIEDKLGFYEKETEAAQNRNPQMKLLIDKISSLEKKIDEINGKN